MRLWKALEVNRGDIVSLVGAGGKTAVMYRLADELAAAGWRVVTTTTTMIRPEKRSEQTILEPQGTTLLEKVGTALERRSHVTVAAGLTENQEKLVGVDPSLVDQMVASPAVDVVIVEADGAKGRSLKAPAAHEPVIPSATSILMPIAAIDALGQRLDERIAHRPEMIASLLNVELGEMITREAIASILVHPQGGLKNAPDEARVIPLINKVTAAQMDPARDIAQQLLLTSSPVQRVLLGAVAEEDPIKEAWGRVAAIVLAAGESRRFGFPKQLLPWREKTLLKHVVDVVLGSSVEDTSVVLGYRAEQIGALLKDRPVRLVINEDWEKGLSSSVKAGLQALPANYEACLFLLGDQPNITTELISTILNRYRRTLAAILAPSYRGLRGNPALFVRSLFPELLTLEGDRGGREVIQRHQDELETVEVEKENIFLDIDTVADYQAAQSSFPLDRGRLGWG
jgi:molybdenum cofactor cytidylyltransferase